MKHPIPSILSLALVLVLGLGACGKSEEPAEEEAAPKTGTLEQTPAPATGALTRACSTSRG